MIGVNPHAVAQLHRAHDAGLVNEDALAELLEKLLQGHPLALDDLCAVFGLQAINDLLDRRRPREGLSAPQAARLQEIYDRLNTTPENGVVPHIVHANLQLVLLLREVL